jgi:hypothetical protein
MGILASIEGDRVNFASGATVTFPFPVGGAIEFGDVVVVRLEPPRGTIFNENVYGLGRDGHVIWQIKSVYPPTWDGAWGGLENVRGEAVLSNSESKVLHVDPRTGFILKNGIQVR